MAGSDYILGGLLSGLGKGQELSYLEMREAALRKLKGEETIAAEQRAEDRTIAAEGRAHTRARELAADKARYDIMKLRESGAITSAANEQKFGFSVKLEQIKGDEDRKSKAFQAKLDQNLAVVRADLWRRNTRDSLEVKAALENKNDPVVDQFNDNNQQIWYRTKSGVAIPTGIYAEAKVDTSMPWEEKKDKPTSRSDRFDPREQGSGGRADWYSTNTGSSAPGNATSISDYTSYGTAPRKSDPNKVATLAQVREAANATGRTEAEMLAYLRAEGWRIR